MKEEMGTSKEESNSIDLENYRRLVRTYIDMVIAFEQILFFASNELIVSFYSEGTVRPCIGQKKCAF